MSKGQPGRQSTDANCSSHPWATEGLIEDVGHCGCPQLTGEREMHLAQTPRGRCSVVGPPSVLGAHKHTQLLPGCPWLPPQRPSPCICSFLCKTEGKAGAFSGRTSQGGRQLIPRLGSFGCRGMEGQRPAAVGSTAWRGTSSCFHSGVGGQGDCCPGLAAGSLTGSSPDRDGPDALAQQMESRGTRTEPAPWRGREEPKHYIHTKHIHAPTHMDMDTQTPGHLPSSVPSLAPAQGSPWGQPNRH